MGTLKIFYFKNSAAVLSLYLASSGTSVSSALGTELPPLATSADAVRDVFDVRTVRPLEHSSFEPLRKYFSAKQQKNVDEFLHALENLIAVRNHMAKQVGIEQGWWWPPDLDMAIHLVIKNDPLTNRATSPDEIHISAPKLVKAKLELTVKELYNQPAQDGTDLGGFKTSKVTLVPEHRRWVIDEITFQVRQYGRTNTVTLTQILAQETKQLGDASHKMANRRVETRPAQPASKH